MTTLLAENSTRAICNGRECSCVVLLVAMLSGTPSPSSSAPLQILSQAKPSQDTWQRLHADLTTIQFITSAPTPVHQRRGLRNFQLDRMYGCIRVPAASCVLSHTSGAAMRLRRRDEKTKKTIEEIGSRRNNIYIPFRSRQCRPVERPCDSNATSGLRVISCARVGVKRSRRGVVLTGAQTHAKGRSR